MSGEISNYLHKPRKGYALGDSDFLNLDKENTKKPYSSGKGFPFEEIEHTKKVYLTLIPRLSAILKEQNKWTVTRE